LRERRAQHGDLIEQRLSAHSILNNCTERPGAWVLIQLFETASPSRDFGDARELFSQELPLSVPHHYRILLAI